MKLFGRTFFNSGQQHATRSKALKATFRAHRNGKKISTYDQILRFIKRLGLPLHGSVQKRTVKPMEPNESLAFYSHYFEKRLHRQFRRTIKALNSGDMKSLVFALYNTRTAIDKKARILKQPRSFDDAAGEVQELVKKMLGNESLRNQLLQQLNNPASFINQIASAAYEALGKEGSSTRPDYNRMIMYSFANILTNELAMQLLDDQYQTWLDGQAAFNPDVLASFENHANFLPQLSS